MADRFTDDQPRYFSGVGPALFRHLLTAGEVFWKDGGVKENVLYFLFRVAEGTQEGRVGVGKMTVAVDADHIVGLGLEDGGEKFLFAEQFIFGLLQFLIVPFPFFEGRFE